MNVFSRGHLCKLFQRGCLSKSNVEVKQIHTTLTTSASKRKRPFHNKYIQQLKNRSRIDNSYAFEVLRKQDERTYQPNDNVEDINFQEELIREGRRRHKAYKHRQRMKEFTKGPGERLLTWKQMEHARFLRQTNPEEWNVKTLSYSFQVPEEVMIKVLHSKISPQDPDVQAKLDAKARMNRGFGRLPSPLYKRNEAKSSKSLVPLETKDKQSLTQNEQSWGLPDWKKISPWFVAYEKGSAKLTDNTTARQPKTSIDSGVTWMDDDDCEFYSYLYRDADEWQEMDEEEEKENHDDFEEENEDLNHVKSNDGKSFYTEDDEFLYRV